jgi:two-component system sensor histidine kinase KdpD
MVDMNGERPDPDALLARVQAEAARARRGRLKIFFGASAGVGKTYAMLAGARIVQSQGRKVVIGIVETHGRAETVAMTQDLQRLPLRSVPHRDRELQEFDPDAALAFAAQNPGALVLIDELAHNNAPGSRHPKRWQDVEELLNAGLDVWTTVNVQHLESLNDIVSGITQIQVWETVPDRVFDRADEVVVVDLPPDELLQRLKQGKVYLPQQAELAAKNFFRKGNLLALRELALRRTADRVDDQMQTFRRESVPGAVWPNREALLACIGPDDQGEQIVRKCARMAAQQEVPWHAVHVETPQVDRLPEARRTQVLRVLKLAQELGAVTATLSAPDPASALIRYAREQNLARLVLGRPQRRVRWPWQAELVPTIEAQARDLDVLQVAHGQSGTTRLPGTLLGSKTSQPLRWQGYGAAALICALTALLATPLIGVLDLTNIVMLFLLAAVGIGVRFGRGPAVAAAFFGVALFDYFFVPPRFTFAVSDVQYLPTFGIMLLVALVIGQLAAGLKVQASAATAREQRMRSLYEMARDLSTALMTEQVAEIGARFLRAEFHAGSALLVADDNGELRTMPGASATVDISAARWAYDHGEPAGPGTDTLPSSACLVLPLKATMRVRGAMAVAPDTGKLLGPEQYRLLETCASLLANSLERIHYIDVAQRTTVQMESERLRNSLLAAISHDLRTPLASLIGLADTLQLTKPPPAPEQQEITLAIRNSALRMSALVNNLLDMARLESGSVKLNRQWQPLEEVIGSALATTMPILAGRPLKVLLPDDLPLLQFDAVLMERVFVNLLENIAKYTPEGSGIEISARPARTHVEIFVDDQGPGLPPGRHEAIFEKFERGHRETATTGVGLGLAICRAIMRVHDGTIRGETRPEGGARFILRLPCGTPPSDYGAHAPGADPTGQPT